MNKFQIIIRLYKSYTKRYIKNIILAFIFSIFLAGSTSSVAYLLDPAIEKLFIDQNQSLIILIPIFIILAFAIKGFSLYMARVLMIGVSEEVKKDIQKGEKVYLDDFEVLQPLKSLENITSLEFGIDGEYVIKRNMKKGEQLSKYDI